MPDLKKNLESIYRKYNKREFINPDPLYFLYNYPDKRNREIIGLISACFAYGRVEMIMKTIKSILTVLGEDPCGYITDRAEKDIKNDFKGFKYRFADETHLTSLLLGIKKVLNRFSSLENCFLKGYSRKDETVVNCLTYFYQQIAENRSTGHLLADPGKNSACKRSHLFLRWMVRQDTVDPGGWDTVNPSKLVVPLDTHMYKIGKMLGFTERKSRDIKTAMEITQGFRGIDPLDPVKYDFCLTRFGIRNDMSMESLKKGFKNEQYRI